MAACRDNPGPLRSHQRPGLLGARLAADLPRRRPDDGDDPDQQRGTRHATAERVKNASGLFNLTRNLGGAIGLAALTTILNDRIDLHLARLHERLTFASKPALETLDALAQQLQRHGSDDKAMALKQPMQMTHT